MFDDDTRLRELSNKALEGAMTDEEFAELAVLSKNKQRLREARASMIADLRQTLESRGVTIHDLFSAAEIAAAVAPQSNSLGQRVVHAVAKASVRMPGKRGTWKRQKTEQVLIEVKQDGIMGFPSRYSKGQLFPLYVSKGLKLLDDGQLEANLARYYTAEGREYFATEVGKAELDRLVNYIKTHRLNPRLK